MTKRWCPRRHPACDEDRVRPRPKAIALRSITVGAAGLDGGDSLVRPGCIAAHPSAAVCPDCAIDEPVPLTEQPDTSVVKWPLMTNSTASGAT